VTFDEMIEVMIHFRDGGQVEYRHKGGDVWEDSECPAWKFHRFEYRKKPEKKTRLMKAEELKGKWIKRADVKEMVVRIVDDEIETVLQGPRGVEYFHKLGWTLEDGSPLTVEVSE